MILKPRLFTFSHNLLVTSQLFIHLFKTSPIPSNPPESIFHTARKLLLSFPGFKNLWWLSNWQYWKLQIPGWHARSLRVCLVPNYLFSLPCHFLSTYAMLWPDWFIGRYIHVNPSMPFKYSKPSDQNVLLQPLIQLILRQPLSQPISPRQS